MSLRIKERCIFQIKDRENEEQAKRAESVTSVDIHPTEPWVLSSFKSGHVCISDYNSQVKLKSFEISKSPVGAAKFIARKRWFVAAGDKTIYCYNYNTRKKVKQLCPPSYCITYLEVHPTRPYVMSSAYDVIFLWNWNNNWACDRMFECDSRIIKHISFNPDDLNTFASASNSGKIMIWDLRSSHPCFTLEDENSVNCVDYLTKGGKSLVITGSDDHASKLWDYHEKRCVQKLEGHTGNVSAVCVILDRQVIITGSKDGTIRIWDVVDYSLENVKDYSLGSVLAIRYMKGLPGVVIGYDKGIVVVDFIQEEPVVSMDSSGKIMWAKHKEFQIIKLLSADTEHEIADGCKLDLEVIKQVNYDNNPQSLKHNPDGSFVAVCGDDEYIIYETKQWTKKSSGSAKDVVWSSDGAYAILESTSIIKFFSNNFEEKKIIHPEMSVESIHGGNLLAICSKNSVLFYDWASYVLVHRTGILNVKNLYWAESGKLVAVTTTTSFHVIKYHQQDLDSAHRRLLADQGDAFTSFQKIEQVVRSGVWVDDCFIYTICSGELNCWVGGKVTTISHLDRPMYLMGYLANQSRVYLVDKKLNFVSYTIVPSLIKCKELYMDGDWEQARKVLPLVPKKHLNSSLAHFLDSQLVTKDALDISKRHPKQNIAQKIGRGTKILKQLDKFAMSSTMNPCCKAGKRGREQKQSNIISGHMVAARRGLEWRGIELPGFLDDPPDPLPQPPLEPNTEFATGQPPADPNDVRQRQPRIDPHPDLAPDQPLPNPNEVRQRQPCIDPHPDLAPDQPLPDLNDVRRCRIVDNWRSLKGYE